MRGGRLPTLAGAHGRGLGRQVRTFEAIDGAISDFERGAWRSAASAPAASTQPDDGTSELRQLLDAAETRYRAAGQAIAAASEGAR